MPTIVTILLRNGAWRDRVLQEMGQRVTFDHFEQFIAAPPLEGLRVARFSASLWGPTLVDVRFEYGSMNPEPPEPWRARRDEFFGRHGGAA